MKKKDLAVKKDRPWLSCQLLVLRSTDGLPSTRPPFPIFHSHSGRRFMVFVWLRRSAPARYLKFYSRQLHWSELTGYTHRARKHKIVEAVGAKSSLARMKFEELKSLDLRTCKSLGNIVEAEK